MKQFIYFSILFCLLNAEIIYESGDLREFIGGTSETTAYDNYVSHVSEGIAAAGYNDYGPDWLDVQTNGFGNYRIIPGGSNTLFHWRNIFTQLLSGDITGADALLTDSLATFHYNLVEFSDTPTGRTYYMIRENLDLSYTDVNTPDPDDDVHGSFRNGWGLFILNPQAARQHVVVEVPHPCDDFIAPYLGTELFLQSDAIAMMIAGAGREVRWTEDGDYSNNKSLTDPARNSNSVFQVYHEVLSDSLMQTGPHSPLILHTHSFDDNESHEGFRAIVLSAGWDAGYVNKPIRDVTDEHLDFVNFTEEIPIPANTFGNHEDVTITDYYQVHYNGSFQYIGENQNYSMPHTYTLLGPNTGVQMNYLRQFFDNRSVYEPWVQCEFHEKPELFQDMEMPLNILYAGNYPTSYQNFSILLSYFQPFISAAQAYLDNWDNVPDVTAPPQVQNVHSIYDGYHYVSLEWENIQDTNFRTYRVYYDIGDVTEDSPFWDINDDSNLLDMRVTTTTLTGLAENGDYLFKLQGIDHFDNAGDLSEPGTDFIPGHEPHQIIENFDDGDIVLDSYTDQDIDPDDWVLTPERTYMESPLSLKLFGNTWKSQEIAPVQIVDGTVWQVASYTQTEGEIHGFGLIDSVNTLFYSFSGTQLLDIEEWVPVYQGYFPEDKWNVYPLPVADDWFAWYDYYPTITAIVYINDIDDEDEDSIVYFDEVVDVTPVLAIPPEVDILFSIGDVYRNTIGSRNVDVDFTSIVNDPDSDYHQFYWNFGDGETSTEANPSHTFLVEDDHEYTVLLQVVDHNGHWGNATVQIAVDPGESSFPITLNFVGDIMLGRRYDDEDGIIETNGVESIFEPTLEILGNAADISVANLEIPLTNYGDPHPTKSVVFKGNPDNADGLEYAGIDIVSLANNHTLDYGLTGLVSTQNVLNQRDIRHSGSGSNTYEAYLPLFYNERGVNFAFLANCDRTGQYNNAQPYLQAGYDKPGFAYMTPYYLQQQIEEVQDIADFIIMEMHAGSEYSFSPGAGYDSFSINDLLDPDDYSAPEENTRNMDLPDISDEDENYSPYLDIPHMWDREIRHFAIDAGADMVIIHHPHIIQGFEVYQGKLIAHSLGNFVFDLNYEETYPTVILNVKTDETGFYEHHATPAYIDDYIPLPATGQLGLHILDYLAKKSRELDTYMYVDRETLEGYVILDSLTMTVRDIDCRRAMNVQQHNGQWVSDPVPIHNPGNITAILPPEGPGNWQFRLGRQLLWYGNMEDEGSSQWNVNSADEWLDETQAVSGSRSIAHRRFPDSGDNIVTNLESRIKINADLDHTIQGYIKTQNGGNVTIEVRHYRYRTTGTQLATHDVDVHLNGDHDWGFYWDDTDPPSQTAYFDIRLNSDMPASGEALSWFDDVSVVEWTEWDDIANAADFITPNDYYFIQLRSDEYNTDMTVDYLDKVFDEGEMVIPDFTASQTEGLAPADIQFTNQSYGFTGWWLWDFGDGFTSIEENPIHTYATWGSFDVTLTVRDYDGNTLSELKSDFINLVPEHLPGDVNFDGVNNILDIVLMVNFILDVIDPDPLQEEVSDMNLDGQLNILDVIVLINVILDN